MVTDPVTELEAVFGQDCVRRTRERASQEQMDHNRIMQFLLARNAADQHF